MRSKEEVASEMVGKHYQVEAGLTHVFRLVGPPDLVAAPTETIKLLEVNACTVPAGIMPLWFGASPGSGMDYSFIIVEVTPEEFPLIASGEIPLSNGWRIDIPIPDPHAAVSA